MESWQKKKLISVLCPLLTWTSVSVIDAGKVLRSFCLSECPWTVLDPTVDLLLCVDDLEFLSAARLSKSGLDGALDPVCVLAGAVIGPADAAWKSGLRT